MADSVPILESLRQDDGNEDGDVKLSHVAVPVFLPVSE